MQYIQATEENLEAVYELIQNTISEIYPKYYPREVVSFFCEHHSREKVLADIKKGHVKIVLVNGSIVGTGSYVDNHITRVFVSPEFQGKGYGRLIMERLECEVMEKHNDVYLDASLPATQMYEHLGYQTMYHNSINLDNNAVLVYGIMKKTEDMK